MKKFVYLFMAGKFMDKSSIANNYRTVHEGIKYYEDKIRNAKKSEEKLVMA